jgi:dipeptidyl aminopeptidase/acylaminoacyl peptidase
MRSLGRLSSILCVTFLPLVPAWPAQGSETTRVLTLERYLDWEDLANPQISPDGRQIVYERKWVDALNDRWETDLWVIGSDGSRHRFLARGSAPRWSPDGSRIAFLAKGEPEGTQIFVRWMDAQGAVSQVTRVRGKPSQIAWSPDGRSIAFQMVLPPEESPNWRIDMPRKPEKARWTDSPRIVERLHYRRDRTGYLPRGFRHIFVVPADGGTPHQVTSGDWHHGGFRWTPDGESSVFHSLRIEDAEYQWREAEIYAAELASGQIRPLTTRKGPDRNPVPSPDGRWIAYVGYDWTDDAYVEAGLYVMAADGSNPRRIASEQGRLPRNLIWAADGSGVYFTARLQGASNLHFAPLSGEPRPITEGRHVLRVTDLAPDGLAVGTLSEAHAPRNLVAFDTAHPGALRALHVSNATALSEVDLGEVEEIRSRSVDDLEIQGWIVKPPGFEPSRRYPLILRIHGGPHSMYDVRFDFKNQEHAANGYVVLYTNPRGSSGYGSAFGNAIKNAYPSRDYDDLMAGVDEIVSRGYIDDSNLFVYGGSGGGVLTAWIVGHTDRFRAAVAKAPVINWLSFVGTTDGTGWYRNFAKLPWEDPSEHLRRSPLTYVGNVSTPTMLMTGEKDLRTPMEQTEQFYQALKLRKVPTAMIRLADGWHSRSLPPTNLIRVQLYLRKWFERFMMKHGEHAEAAPR